MSGFLRDLFRVGEEDEDTGATLPDDAAFEGAAPQATAPTAQVVGENPRAVQRRQRKIDAGVQALGEGIESSRQALENTAAAFPVAGGLAKAGSAVADAAVGGAKAGAGWLRGVLSATRAGGPAAGARVAAPAALAAAPLVEGVVLGEKAPIAGAGAIGAMEGAGAVAAERAAASELAERVVARARQRGTVLNPIPAAVEAAVDAAPRVNAAVGRAFDAVAEKARPVGAFFDRLAGAAGFRYNDALSQFESPFAGVNLDTLLAFRRNAAAGAPRTAAEMARGLQTAFTKEESAAINKYLTGKRNLEVLRKGMKVADREQRDALGAVMKDVQGNPLMRPTTEQDVLGDIDAARGAFTGNRFGMSAEQMRENERRLLHEETKFRDWNADILRRAKASDLYDPSYEGDPNYVHRIVEDFYTGKRDPLMRRAPGEQRPDATKALEGTRRQIVENPYQATAVADMQARRYEAAKEFERDVLAKHDLTGKVEFDKSKHALYDFKQGIARYDADAEQELARGLGNFKVLPKKLVDGLARANAPAGKQTFWEALLTPGARWAKNSQLLMNPAFQTGQVVADYATHLFNLPVREWPEFTKRAVKNAGELIDAYKGARGYAGRTGEYHASKLLERGREQGTITDVMETLFDRPADMPEFVPEKARGFWELLAGKSEGKVMADSTLPRHLQQGRSRVGGAWEDFREGMNAVGQVRESAFKSAHAEVLRQRGVNDVAAAAWANRISGNYWKNTDSGRLAGKVALFSKWYAEQVLRLTRDIAKNPATGRSDWAGLTSGPAPKIAAMALLTHILNNRDNGGRISKAAANLASRDSTAIVLDVDEKGNPLVLVPDTLNKVAAAGGWYAKEAATDPMGALKDFVGGIANRAETNPILKPIGLAMRDTPRDERDLTSAEKRALNAKRGGFPFLQPAGQEMSDSITGGPGRVLKGALQHDTTDPNLPLLRALGLAAPGAGIYRRGAKDRYAEERARNKGDVKQQFIDAARDPNPTASTQRDAREAAQVLMREYGATEAELKAAITKGAKSAAELDRFIAEDRRARQRARLGTSAP